jgi:outer membrane cobalamin receptor
VTAQRMQQELLGVPGAIGVVDQEAIQRAQRQLTFAESLGTVPGVFIHLQHP